jgi:hydrogenase maturation protease
VLIIGYGNPMRQDDAAGYVASERLNGLAVQQLTPELAADLAAADEALFIDADSTVEPGAWTVTELLPCQASAITHSCTPQMLLALARVLYGQAPRALLIRIGASQFGYGQDVTPCVSRAVDEVVAYVREHATAPR